MNNSTLFLSIVTIALSYTSVLPATKSQINQKLEGLKAQLSMIDTAILTSSAPQDNKNAQMKNNLEITKRILKEIIEQQQEALSAQ